MIIFVLIYVKYFIVVRMYENNAVKIKIAFKKYPSYLTCLLTHTMSCLRYGLTTFIHE